MDLYNDCKLQESLFRICPGGPNRALFKNKISASKFQSSISAREGGG